MSDQTLPRILAIDDDQSWLDQVPMILEDECVVDGYPTIDQGIQAIETQFYDVVLLDLNFVGDPRSGLDVFHKVNAAGHGADVIVISGETNHRNLIDLFNAGVTRFLSKPATPDEIRQAVRKTLEMRQVRARAATLLSKPSPNGLIPLIGSSARMRRLREDIERVVAAGTRDILLTGETGTGKEVVAQHIAHTAGRASKMLAIHCGAIADGLIESELFGHVRGAFTGAERDKAGAFEAAAGGYVFLDEIGEMPLLQQAKLLRVLQERVVTRVGSHEARKVNFRTISATHVRMDEAIAEKRFREDLFYRIAKEKIEIPSLRERAEDIPELVHYFLAEAPVARRKSITQEALGLLQSYSWPGNVRQLKAVIEALEARAEGGVIREKDVCQQLPETAQISSARLTRSLVGRYGSSLILNERRRFEKALIDANGDRTQAAQLLGISRATFFRKAKDLGLVKARGAEISRL